MNNLLEQKKLASIIKGIHKDLRDLSKEVGAEEAWKIHLENKTKLDLYAKTMKELSESHWKAKNTTALDDRIQWIINYSEFYFQPTELENFRRKDLDVMEKLKSEGCTLDNNDFEACSDTKNLNVLDVGSNGNFFKEHKRFQITPIDIAPSSTDCFYCDFLTVPLSQELSIKNNEIDQLQINFYDIVIFCLLLEYLPTSSLRIKCCEKAYQVLRTEGILIIITPDSSSQHRNAQQIKCWKWTLAMLGFRRIKVEKLKNLSCMVFRKSLSKDISVRWAEKYKEDYMEFKLAIPQDRNLKDEGSDEEIIEETNDNRYKYEPHVMNSEMPFDF